MELIRDSAATLMSLFRLRVTNARNIVQVCAHGESYKTGIAQNELPTDAICLPDLKSRMLENASLIVVDQEGKIASFGSAGDVEMWLSAQPCAHASRVELQPCQRVAMKLAGATYMELHKSGGGINKTVRHTKKSSEAELLELLRARLDRMLRYGTTLVETKSGYGLETEAELKMLRVLHIASNGENAHPVEIVSNYLGGHSIPDGMSAADATEDIVNKQIPAVGVFEQDDTRRIIEAGKKAGLEINFHGDEIHSMQSGAIAAALGARAIYHCEMLTADDLQAHSLCLPCCYPTTKYILKLPNPPARDMIAAGVPVALGRTTIQTLTASRWL
ncbi:hypothetical protein PsorP6_008173 [Peronosclerospora sorghi]|uniref:Uncharacterized protein n=1 Tax=Peronosclerospora sorghi TaxID=230839 RepID=A0ACC0W6G0_9STRA|nr:hypothetical protein PsorP6_008173 [Peronosclerospora sorghi]